MFFVMSQYVCLTTRCYTTSHLHQVFFWISLDFLAFFAHISYFKCLEFKEINENEAGYSHLGATRLVNYLPSHSQRALME